MSSPRILVPPTTDANGGDKEENQRQKSGETKSDIPALEPDFKAT